MRNGELLGLRKRDVNLPDGTILVGRSYDHDTTKGGHADLIPIAEPLRPFLEGAIRESPSALVFPRSNGSMHPKDVKLDRVLRRALGRAGVVTGYDHRTRRKGCGYSKEEPGNAPGRCPRFPSATCTSGRARPGRLAAGDKPPPYRRDGLVALGAGWAASLVQKDRGR
jgi:hypothetical protein